ncbi:Monothiol glutaredoxin-S13 [Sesamum angolense]|uniref:Monothiol glutaredoxin-S13 n=1 Tax=Sesamum angolense TaxID=2727404 RepID=A0AAE1WTU1_9LAMI|nr:Monothiol glutaredoxin-S13 [Sesamum angolense]
MQQAIPYRGWLPTAASPGGSAATQPPNSSSGEDTKSVRNLVAENAVVVFARKGCCMCHVVKLLLHGHGVSPTIVHVDDQTNLMSLLKYRRSTEPHRSFRRCSSAENCLEGWKRLWVLISPANWFPG